jgi:hypothetical protein
VFSRGPLLQERAATPRTARHVDMTCTWAGLDGKTSVHILLQLLKGYRAGDVTVLLVPRAAELSCTICKLSAEQLLCCRQMRQHCPRRGTDLDCRVVSWYACYNLRGRFHTSRARCHGSQLSLASRRAAAEQSYDLQRGRPGSTCRGRRGSPRQGHLFDGLRAAFRHADDLLLFGEVS